MFSWCCRRCGGVVSFVGVSAGYFAVCEYHDEDLFSFEVGDVS